PGTIRWHVAHLAHYNRYYARVLLMRNEPGTVEPLPRVALGRHEDDVVALKATHDALRATIATLSDADLASTLPSGQVIGAFLRAIIRHNAWHAGQIAMMRRLIRMPR